MFVGVCRIRFLRRGYDETLKYYARNCPSQRKTVYKSVKVYSVVRSPPRVTLSVVLVIVGTRVEVVHPNVFTFLAPLQRTTTDKSGESFVECPSDERRRAPMSSTTNG